MKVIVNFTQHNATPEQQEQGVVDTIYARKIKELITFEGLPTAGEVKNRAIQILGFMLQIEMEYEQEEGVIVDFMVGGAPFLMGALATIEDRHLSGKLLCAFSERVSKEMVDEDGEVVKTSVFKHQGFVPLNPLNIG